MCIVDRLFFDQFLTVFVKIWHLDDVFDDFRAGIFIGVARNAIDFFLQRLLYVRICVNFWMRFCTVKLGLIWYCILPQ
jgi:hypothetical protein